jgi:hypothetical protein
MGYGWSQSLSYENISEQHFPEIDIWRKLILEYQRLTGLRVAQQRPCLAGPLIRPSAVCMAVRNGWKEQYRV